MIYLLVTGSLLHEFEISHQVLLESKPQSNPYRIKMKPQPTDQAVLATLQTVPGLGQKKAMALLSKFNSK